MFPLAGILVLQQPRRNPRPLIGADVRRIRLATNAHPIPDEQGLLTTSRQTTPKYQTAKVYSLLQNGAAGTEGTERPHPLLLQMIATRFCLCKRHALQSTYRLGQTLSLCRLPFNEKAAIIRAKILKPRKEYDRPIRLLRYISDEQLTVRPDSSTQIIDQCVMDFLLSTQHLPVCHPATRPLASSSNCRVHGRTAKC